jgi:hypothetical protein
MADAVEDGEKIVHRFELQKPLAEFAALHHLSFEYKLAGGRRKYKPFADGNLPTRPHKGAPEVASRCRLRFAASHPFRRRKRKGWGTQRLWRHRFGEHHFNAAGWFLVVAEQGTPGVKARRNHAAFVQDQQVAGIEQRGKFGKIRVAQSSGCAIHHQHTALAALGGRLLRDQLRGQVKIEIDNAQASRGIVFFSQVRHARGFLK